MKNLPISFNFDHSVPAGSLTIHKLPKEAYEYFLIPEYNIITKEIIGYSMVHRTMVMSVKDIEANEKLALERYTNGKS